MTNILYWNLENFGISKINALTPAGMPFALLRRGLIYNILAATNPDIIVIVEVSTGASPTDLATNTGGIRGAAFLLNQLRLNLAAPGPNAAQWRMVPPLRVGAGGTTETVAVLYRGVSTVAGGGVVNRYFTGPNVWTGGGAGISQVPGGGVAAAAYPAVLPGSPNINAFLVVPPAAAARMIPLVAQHNGGLAENLVAARIRFAPAAAPPVGFPALVGGHVDYTTHRQPFMVTFVETNAAGVLQRNLTLFAVHARPAYPLATAFIDTLMAGTADIVNPAAGAPANEVKIICGDFNLNSIRGAAPAPPNPPGSRTTAYDALRSPPLPVGAGYTPLLDPPPAMPVGINLEAYQGYLATHIRPQRTDAQRTQNSRFLWSDNSAGLPAPIPSPYPGYRYIGSDMVGNFFSIDNILVNTPAAPAGGFNFTVMNPVVGTPFNLVAVPAGVPTGAVVMGHQFMALPPAVGGVPFAWPQSPAPNYNVGNARTLNARANYGYIRRTSDHLALFATV